MKDESRDAAFAKARAIRPLLAGEFPWAATKVRAERWSDGWAVLGSVYHGRREAHFCLGPGELLEQEVLDSLHARLERPAGPVAMRDVEVGHMVGDRAVVKIDRSKRLVWVRGNGDRPDRLRLSAIVRLKDGTLARRTK